jgi:caa(3)-type oxidase subunit IV
MGDTMIMGKDIYFWNFLVLMVFTVVEVAAVFYGDSMDLKIVWAILIGVGIIKAYGIAAFFMHLKGDPIVYTMTALFPIAFVVLMLWGIGLSNPDSIIGLPSWCTPNWDYTYVTN